jgi:hypothetical protein
VHDNHHRQPALLHADITGRVRQHVRFAGVDDGCATRLHRLDKGVCEPRIVLDGVPSAASLTANRHNSVRGIRHLRA